MVVFAVLIAVGFVAGFCDSIGGGGGLITLPSLMLLGLPDRVALGTNKGQAIFGLGVSLARYAHSSLLDRKRIPVSFVAGFAGSVIGALAIVQIPQAVLRVIVIVLMLGAAASMLLQRDRNESRPRRDRSLWLAATIAVVLGFYDGFFGPGMGIFLIMAYAWLWRDPLDCASANAKVVNFASGLAAAITFAANGLIVWKYALPMALGQVVGGYLGAHTVIRSGKSVVRVFVVVMALAQVGYLIWRASATTTPA